jgi:hypothetical protein
MKSTTPTNKIKPKIKTYTTNLKNAGWAYSPSGRLACGEAHFVIRHLIA